MSPHQPDLEAACRVSSGWQHHAQVLFRQWFEFDKVLQTSLARFVVDVFRATFDRFVGIIVWNIERKESSGVRLVGVKV